MKTTALLEILILGALLISALGHSNSYAENPEAAQQYFYEAYEYARKGNYPVAVEIYRKGVQSAPKDQLGHFFLAEALERLGGHEKEALAEYTIARDLNATSERGVMAAVRILALEQLARGFRDCNVCPEMVAIPAGKFVMGIPIKETEAYNASAVPTHTVTIAKPFAAGRYEVTRGEFAQFVRQTAYSNAGVCPYFNGQELIKNPSINWRNPGFAQTDRDPVVCVNWRDAKAYAEWLSRETGKKYRLPSEAEWEYAALAGSQTTYPWGDNLEEACRYANVWDASLARAEPWWLKLIGRVIDCDDRYGYTAPVGSYQANAFGLYDMVGNVNEWTEDCEHYRYDGAPSDGSAWLAGNCSNRMIRGGSWFPGEEKPREPSISATSSQSTNVGFRVARDLP